MVEVEVEVARNSELFFFFLRWALPLFFFFFFFFSRLTFWEQLEGKRFKGLREREKRRGRERRENKKNSPVGRHRVKGDAGEALGRRLGAGDEVGFERRHVGEQRVTDALHSVLQDRGAVEEEGLWCVVGVVGESRERGAERWVMTRLKKKNQQLSCALLRAAAKLSSVFQEAAAEPPFPKLARAFFGPI